MSDGFPREGRPDRQRGGEWTGPFDCPPPELILPALEGALPDPPAAAVRAHVSSCAICSELAAALASPDGPSSAARARIDRRVLGTPARHSAWFELAAAAAVVLAVGSAYLAMRPAPERVDLPPVHWPDAPAVAHATPEHVLALAAPSIELPPESLVLRSESRSSYAADLERALEFFNRGDYAVAAARLEHLARQFPDKPHAQFYLGAALLLRGDGAAAIRPLERARTLAGRGASLYSEATWYLAVALERSGRGGEALDPLAQLCGEGGPRGQQGCDGLSRLLNNR